MAELTGTFVAHSGRPLPPAKQRATVYDRETGAPLEVFPVDAREMVASGQYTTTPPALVEAAEEPPHAPPAAAPAVGLSDDEKPLRGKRR